EFLARRTNSKLTPKEREELYMKWDRKLQFVNKLWTDPYDSRHRCLSPTLPCLQIRIGTITRFLVKFETITIILPCMILAPVPRPLDSGYNKPQF
ncbi:hypothetical protein HID58_084926, partial [Brassica napus]